MLSCWRTARAAEPELYTRALMYVLLHYPAFVVMAVTEPATGIAQGKALRRYVPVSKLWHILRVVR